MLKHEGLVFACGKEEIGECSKFVQRNENSKTKGCISSLKQILSLQDENTTKINFGKDQ
jgi:hypothetical protein